VAQNFGVLFSTEKVTNYYFKKWVGLHFGRFYHKLIWSPCPGVRERTAAKIFALLSGTGSL
jgi:hypothetical protein